MAIYKGFALTPTYGIAWQWMDQNNKSTNSDVDEPQINLRTNHALGLTLDWQIRPTGNYYPNYNYYFGSPNFSFTYIRARIGYLIPHPGTEVLIENQIIDGRSLFVNLGIGFTIHPKKKVRF
ncbi:MAG: hypothetical protein K9H16_13270 [Bacteroidales bacterium]|nr:hypothetical protein [Bacteroidales bacterium]